MRYSSIIERALKKNELNVPQSLNFEVKFEACSSSAYAREKVYLST